jgi:hypothetical protein
MKPNRGARRAATLARRFCPVALALALGTCHQAPLTAPPGSTITVFANPTFIPAFGGVSVISALLIEPAGTPVADGTVVQFFTDLGTIDPQGKTNDGVARVNLVSDSRSGQACVQAFSGGPATGGGTGTTTTTLASTTTTVLTLIAQARAFMKQSGDCSVTVDIGSSLPARVLVTASPSVLTSKRASLVTANVYDSNGNPVANVSVIFATDGTTESMDSQGTPTFTNNNGQAQDVLRTHYDPSADAKSVNVTATTANGISGTTAIEIN